MFAQVRQYQRADTTIHAVQNEVGNHGVRQVAVTAHHALVVVNEQQHAVGILTRGDLVRGLPVDGDGTVLDSASTDLLVTYPDEPLHDAITRMLHHNIGRLPVVARDEPTRLVGYLGRGEILGARWRHHLEETERTKGPLLKGLKKLASFS